MFDIHDVLGSVNVEMIDQSIDFDVKAVIDRRYEEMNLSEEDS